jgi:ribonuclease HI
MDQMNGSNNASKGKIIVKQQIQRQKILDGRYEDLNCLDPNYIHVWTDGGGNCGKISIGIVIVERGHIKTTHGEFLHDHSTNNVAELTAILRGLQLVKNKHKLVKIYSDSSYSLNSIVGNYNGRKNRELIEQIVNYVKNYPEKIIFVKVKGHNKLLFNEMADSIASSLLQLQIGVGKRCTLAVKVKRHKNG